MLTGDGPIGSLRLSTVGIAGLTDGNGLAVERERLEALVGLSSDGMAILSGESMMVARVLWANPQFCALVHRLPDGVRNSTIGQLEVASHNGQPLDDWLAQGSGSADLVIEVPGTRRIPVRLTFARIPPVHDGIWAVLVREQIGELLAHEALRGSEERFRALAGNAPIGIFASEAGLRLSYLNDRFAQLWGHPAAALFGMGWLDHVHEQDVSALVSALSVALSGESAEATIRVLVDGGPECRWLKTRASPTWLPGHGAAFVGSVEDVTEYRRQELALAHQATHDPLTDLPNRALLAERVGDALRTPSGKGALALLFLDLDNFKLVNDSLGHHAGDQLLLAVASRLSRGMRRPATVARLGGDEFVVLCQVANPAEALRMADRIQRMVARPVELVGTEVRVTASIGVVVANEHHTDAAGLLRDADIAMYQAKQSGKARSAIFDERVRGMLSDRLTLTGDLRRALDEGQLSSVYQPICDIATLEGPTALGVEALVRWEHPTRGRIDPALLVSLAEESGFIGRLSEFMLDKACKDMAWWRRELGMAAPGYISVNVSPVELNERMASLVLATLERYDLAAADLCLELTETVLMGDDADLAALVKLRERGVRLAVDDFGTGYSSLSYLRRLPVQVVKIDRSFIGNLTEDRSSQAIVSAIIAMSEALGLSVVAEGVETAEQLAKLRALGCRFGQGYLLGVPQTREELVPLLIGAHEPQLHV
jgi:diguanylate cyclase (GGDEF)-like protein/PAS domain S-box-containing protein